MTAYGAHKWITIQEGVVASVRSAHLPHPNAAKTTWAAAQRGVPADRFAREIVAF
jgi:hypothetical protein